MKDSTLPRQTLAWIRYEDRTGHSGVSAYAVTRNAIFVQFVDRRRYKYHGDKPGPQHVAAMKLRARAGEHLATYINQHVRNNYAARVDADGEPLPPDANIA